RGVGEGRVRQARVGGNPLSRRVAGVEGAVAGAVLEDLREVEDAGVVDRDHEEKGEKRQQNRQLDGGDGGTVLTAIRSACARGPAHGVGTSISVWTYRDPRSRTRACQICGEAREKRGADGCEAEDMP